MAGFAVSRDMLDQRAGEAVLAIRGAFEIVEAIASFLATVPADAAEGDRLTMAPEDGGFGYTEDEAYLLRVTFQSLRASWTSMESSVDTARALTGLATIGR